MKRKLFLTFLIISILAFALAISASAAMTGATSNEFGEKISLSGIDLKNMATDDGSRVVLAHTVEGVTYYNTYPANYIVSSKNYNRINYDYINAALSANGEDFTYGDTSVIRLEMPSSATNSNGEIKAMSSLKELIYMPNSSQTSFNTQEFLGASFERIVIPNSITNSGSNVFNNCLNLKTVEFQDEFSCTSLGGGWFAGCTALETFTAPSSVTSLGSNFFKGCTALESIHLENVSSFGQYWLVNCSDGIKIYVSDGVTSFGQFSYDNANPKAVVFYVGAYDGASAIKTAASSNVIKNATTVEYDITKPDSYYVPAEPTAWTIVYNYNECNAFYGRKHDIADEPALTFKDLLSGFHTSAYCERCEMTSIIESYDAVFKMHGYSAKIGGDDICVSYAINKTAYEGYKKVTGKDISFGVVAKVLASNETEAEVLINDNGALSYTGKIINAPVPMNVGSVAFRIKGFSADSSYYALNLVMCAYVFDGEAIDYICYNADGVVSQLATARAVTFAQLATE